MGKIAVSQRRIEANRRNAAKSTGPKTPAGKLKSRRNSLIHGLAGRGSVMPEVEENAVLARYQVFHKKLRPSDEFDEELVHIIAKETVRVERIRMEEGAVRDQLSRQAEASWAEDQRADVEVLARRLKKNPAEVALRLSSTSQGCDWLIERWEWLLGKIEDGEGWNRKDLSLVHDLLGIEADFRKPRKGVKAPGGDALVEHRRALAEDEIERLKIRKYERLDDLDTERRDSIINGFDVTNHPALMRFRRYENTSLRRLEWAFRVLEIRTKRAPVTGSKKNDDGHNYNTGFDIARTPTGYDDSKDHYAMKSGAATVNRLSAMKTDEVLSAYATPQNATGTMEFLYPLTVEEAERKLFGPLSDRFLMSDKAAKREKQARRRLVERARRLERQAQARR